MRRGGHVVLQLSKHQLSRAVLDCLLTCLQRVAEYFNKYAFAHVAIYGTAYLPSAASTWALLRSQGLTALINDDLSNFAIVCGASIGGVVCAVLAGVMAMMGDEVDSGAVTWYALFGFAEGFYLGLTVLNVLTSCICTIFVCYAEDPHAMSTNHCAEYGQLERAKQRRVGIESGTQQGQTQIPI